MTNFELAQKDINATNNDISKFDKKIIRSFKYHDETAPDWFLDLMDGGCCIVGRGSSGCSTLLRTVYGWLPIRKGDVVGQLQTGGLIIVDREKE